MTGFLSRFLNNWIVGIVSILAFVGVSSQVLKSQIAGLPTPLENSMTILGPSVSVGPSWWMSNFDYNGTVNGAAGTVGSGATISLGGATGNVATTLRAFNSGNSATGPLNLQTSQLQLNGVATNVANGLVQKNSNNQIPGSYALSNLTFSATTPTVTSGMCTGTTVTGVGSAGFSVGTGSGACTSTLVLAMPTATNGWQCFGLDPAAAGTSQIQQSSAPNTSSVTLTNYSIGTSPVAINYVVSHTIIVTCTAY